MIEITCKVESLSFVDGEGRPRSFNEGEHAEVDDLTAKGLIDAGFVAKKTGRPKGTKSDAAEVDDLTAKGADNQ